MDLQIIKEHFPKGAALWSLDGSPSGLVDQSGNDKHAAVVSPAVSYPAIVTPSGNSGYAVSGAGRISAGQSAYWKFPYFTFAVWANYNGANGANQWVITNHTGVFMAAMRIGTTGILICMVRTGGVARTVNVGALLPKNNTLLVVTYDGLICRGYQDGVLIGSNAPAVTGPCEYTANPILSIGNQSSSATPFNGSVGTTLVSGDVFSSQQFADYYKAETTPRQKYWLFGAAAGAGAQAAMERVRRAA